MTLNTITKSPLDIRDIRETLSDHLLKFIEDNQGQREPQPVYRFEFPIESIDALAWLSQQPHAVKIYWADREGEKQVAGIGAVDIVTSRANDSIEKIFSKIQKNLSEKYTNLRYYGGFCFDPKNSADKTWIAFGSYYFVLPQFEVMVLNHQTYFICNLTQKDLTLTGRQKIIQEFNKINFSNDSTPPALPNLIWRTDYPNKKQWPSIIEQILKVIHTKKCEKVVLARKSALEFNAPIPAVQLLQNLSQISPRCFYFYIQPEPQLAFLGASPERLYKRQHLSIHSEALAGTRPRGKSVQEDQRLQKELLNSPKELLEHRLVVKAIHTTLKSLTSILHVEKNCSLLQLEGGQHLITPFVGQLRAAVDDATILTQLHPTPAVGGLPTDKAFRLIQKLEPFKRGFYTGAVGSIGNETVEFAVAIRSGLVQKNKLYLYAGAGIVGQSKPEDEWNEIEDKMQIFLQSLAT